MEYAHDTFMEHKSFLDIEIETRKLIAGFPNTVDNFHYGWFGTTRSNGIFSQAIRQNSKEFAKAIDQIPLTGGISRDDFLEHIEICQSAGFENPIGVSTRLLAIKRPDLFFCLNEANKSGICRDLGISKNINAEKYWDEILMRIYDAPWFNSPPPKNDKEAWNGKVALIDCIYYDQFDIEMGKATSKAA